MSNPTGCNTVRSGSKGDCVAFLQHALNTIMNAKLIEDGSFGSLTQGAVVTYQRAKGLQVDGIVGDNTWTSIYTDLSKGTKVTPGSTPVTDTGVPSIPGITSSLGAVNWTTVGIVIALTMFAFMMLQKEFPDEKD